MVNLLPAFFISACGAVIMFSLIFGVNKLYRKDAGEFILRMFRPQQSQTFTDNIIRTLDAAFEAAEREQQLPTVNPGDNEITLKDNRVVLRTSEVGRFLMPEPEIAAKLHPHDLVTRFTLKLKGESVTLPAPHACNRLNLLREVHDPTVILSSAPMHLKMLMEYAANSKVFKTKPDSEEGFIKDFPWELFFITGNYGSFKSGLGTLNNPDTKAVFQALNQGLTAYDFHNLYYHPDLFTQETKDIELSGVPVEYVKALYQLPASLEL